MATRTLWNRTAATHALSSALGVAIASVMGLLGSLASPAMAQGDIELGATQANSYDASASASAPATSTTYRSSSGPRLALQIRLDALTMVGGFDDAPNVGPGIVGRKLLLPVAAPGVRFLDDKLFLGAGLSFYGWSVEEPNGDETSRSGFGLHPLLTFDVVRESAAALSLNGALNIASLGESESCGGGPPGCVDNNDNALGLGLSLGAGIRGLLGPGLAIGGDFGWGFLNVSADNVDSTFVHGLYAALMVEASVGL